MLLTSLIGKSWATSHLDLYQEPLVLTFGEPIDQRLVAPLRQLPLNRQYEAL